MGQPTVILIGADKGGVEIVDVTSIAGQMRNRDGRTFGASAVATTSADIRGLSKNEWNVRPAARSSARAVKETINVQRKS